MAIPSILGTWRMCAPRCTVLPPSVYMCTLHPRRLRHAGFSDLPEHTVHLHSVPAPPGLWRVPDFRRRFRSFFCPFIPPSSSAICRGNAGSGTRGHSSWLCGIALFDSYFCQICPLRAWIVCLPVRFPNALFNMDIPRSQRGPRWWAESESICCHRKYCRLLMSASLCSLRSVHLPRMENM